jgi:Rrf2 family protein
MISQTSEYAIRALSYIVAQGNGRRVLSREISQQLNVPANSRSKILHSLVRATVRGSSRGASGGFNMVCDPREVSLMHIVHLFDGVATRRECFLGQATCSEENPCQVHDRWKPVICSYLGFLEKTTLSEMGERRTV